MSTTATGPTRPLALPLQALHLPPACTRIPLAWTMAGGVVAGGFLVASATLAGRISSGSVTAVSTVLFGLGAAAGFFHGALLAYLARDPALNRKEAVARVAAALLWLIPGAVVAWIATIWVGLSAASLSMGRAPVLVGVALGWAVGLAVCAWAVAEGLSALRSAFARRPEHRWAAVVTSVTFGLLVGIFHTFRPAMPFTDFEVSGVGAVLLALVASVWIALPVALAGLVVLARWRGRTRA